MMQVELPETHTTFANWIRMLESNEEDAILFARGEVPVAKLTLVKPQPIDSCIGIAKGKFTVPDEFDEWDAEIVEMFGSKLA